MLPRISARRTSLYGAAVLTSMAALAMLAVPGFAATPETPYSVTRIDAPQPQADGRWAERTATAGDIDDDGVEDFFVAVPRFDAGADNNRGRVYLLSGRTGTVLYRISSPQPQDEALFGFFISAFGDVNGDGETDIAIGTDAQDVAGNEDQGKAWVFSGSDGRLLYSLDNPAPQANARFGSRIGRAGDVTRDGVSDVIIGASNNDLPAGCGNDGTVEPGCFKDEGQAFIFDGRTGAIVRALTLPPEDRLGLMCSSLCGSFGIAVQGPGDTNGDGSTDQLVGAAGYRGGIGRMYLFNGADGRLLLKIDNPDPQPIALFGFQDAAPDAPGDVNGDGFADLYGNSFLDNGPAGSGQGRAWLFDGRTGAIIRVLDDPTPTAGGQFGWSLAVTDYNKDGRPDQYVGQAPHHVEGTPEDGGTYVFDGRDGSLLKPLELPARDSQRGSEDNGGPRLGWTISALRDLNGDSEPDYLAGAPFADVGSKRDQGRLYVFLSPGARPSPAAPQQPAAGQPPAGQPPAGQQPSGCQVPIGFDSVAARPMGRRLRLAFDRRRSRPVDVAVFQNSVGRRIVGERLVARFSNRSSSFVWNGRANRQGRRVRNGFFFVRYRMKMPDGQVDDVRRVALRRVRGRFRARPSFYRRASCGLLTSFKLERTVFGGRTNRAVGVSYQPASDARVSLTVLRGDRVVRRYPARERRANVSYRQRFDAEKRPRGDYRFRITVVASDGRRVTATLTARRL